MSEPGKPPDFSNISENFTQQQAKITALKELVRQSESQQGRNTASAQEKVKNIAQRLSNLKAKSAKSRHQRSSSEVSDYEFSNIEEEEAHSRDAPETSMRTRSETPGSEKITMLRKQMELNRVKMAERETKSKEIEQMVTQLKSKFETSQMSLEKSFELGRSVGDLSLTSSSSVFHPQLRSSTVADVSHSRGGLNFDNERIRFLEKRLHEMENEKETFTESDKVQELERKILDLEENLKEKESIIDARTKAVSLLSENLTKKKKDVVDSLEETKQEMFRMQEVFLDAESTYKVEVERLNRIIKAKSEETENLNEKIEILEKSRYDLTIENSELKTNLEDVKDYSTKLTELNKINETLQKQIANLESQKYEFVNEEDVTEEKRDSNSEELEEKIKLLEEELLHKSDVVDELDEKLQEKTVELNVVNANLAVLQEKLNSKSTKSPFDTEDDEVQVEATKLKQQLDETNKTAIKDKLKIKQLQKQVDSFKKGNADKEITRLNEEIQSLHQKISEMEEQQKTEGWDSWGGEEASAEMEKRIQILETTCQNQTEAIMLLEQQKLELTKEIKSAKQDSKVDILQELEEKVEKIRQLTEEKKVLDEKLSRYVNQNSELLDKIEELSKGSSASAESIEMVTLTAQETEEYRKTLEGEIQPEISDELNESLKNLREESSELMSKIELFTIERREVLDKLDAVTIENQVLVSSIETLRADKVDLEHENESLKNKVEQNEKLISDLQNEKDDLSTKVSDLNDHRSKLQDEINKLVKESIDASTPQGSPSKSEPAATSEEVLASSVAAPSIDKEACEKLFKQLENDIHSINKNKDRNQKLKISKKLSDNAKNVHAMMTNLFVDYDKTTEECQQLRNDFDKMKSHVDSVMASSKNEEEVIQLKKQLEAKTSEFNELKKKLDELDSDSTKDEMEHLRLKLESLESTLKEKDESAEKLQEMTKNLQDERDRFEMEIQKQKDLASELRADFDNLYADVKVNNQKLHEKSVELDKLQREFDMRLKTSTSEVEILKTLVAEQKQLLIDAYQEHELDINQKSEEITKYKMHVEAMEKELFNLRQQNIENQQNYSSDLNVEIEKLREVLKENEKTTEEHKDELVHKQETIDTLNGQIIDLYKTMEENANRIIEKDDEIQYMQEINDTNRDEIRKLHQKLDESAKNIHDLQIQLDNERSTPRATAVTANQDVDEKIKKLENEVQKLEEKNKESVDKLKKFAANLKKKQAQVADLESKLAESCKVVPSQHVVSDSDVIDDLNSKISCYVEKLQIEESKCDEMEKNLYDFDVKMRDLETEKKQLIDSKFLLQKNLHDYETRIQELEEPVSKLKEMSKEFEKLKKENDELKEKLNSSSHASGEKSEERKKLEKLKATAVQLKHKLTEKKKEVDEMHEQLETLKANQQVSSEEFVNLSQQLNTLNVENEKKLDEMKHIYEQEIAQLRIQIDASNSTINEDKQRKLSLEAQLETFEMTTSQLRDRMSHLEEIVATMETEKNSLQREKLLLVAELEEKDELISRKLRETQDDNFKLCENLKELTNERNGLLQKLSQVESELNSSSLKTANQIAEVESQNSSFQQQILNLQNEIKKLQVSHEQSMAAKHSEIDEMEAELSAQLQKVEAEKKTIQEALEKANDQIVDFQDEVVRLKDTTHSLEQARSDIEREFSWLKLQSENYTQDQLEIEQLRMQLMQSETETENLRSQNENLQDNHNVEITILRHQISDLEAMRSQVSQNQTDDQVMLQNENIRLKELLSERESELSQRNIQMQMASNLFDSPIQPTNDPFSNIVTAPPTTHSQPPAPPNDYNSQELEKLRESLSVANVELDMQSNRVQELLNENQRLSEKLHEMQSITDNLIKNNVELDASVETKQREIDEIKSELKNLRENLNRSTDDEKTHVLEAEFENIQGIVSRFDSPASNSNVPAVPSTSMFFTDEPQPAASLFDDPFIPHQPQPVVEEVIVPKRAYLCYDNVFDVETQTEDDWQSSSQNEIQELQNQIFSLQSSVHEQAAYIQNQNHNVQAYSERIHELEQALEASQNVQQSLHSEIQQLQNQVGNQPSSPEQPIEPVSIQQYFGAPQQNPQLGALEIEDDGWGWASEAQQEAAATVPQRASLLSPRSEVEVRLQEQQDIVERLEHEKNALNEELSNSKENSKKMMKKLKEYQTKIKELEMKSSRKSSSFDSDMDLVIQEELNSQIQKLETKLKEVHAERQKECEEREGLAKKIDVLTSANERMIEMKERQDGQMELYQLKMRDLNQKLANLESWGDEDDKREVQKNVGDSPARADQSEKMAELSAQIKDLQVDLDEVQALLDEEKANNKRLEEKISKMSDSNDLQRLSNQLEDITSERDKLARIVSRKDEQVNELISKIDLLSNESANIRTILEDLSSQNQQKTNENQELHTRLENLAKQNEELSRERQFVNESIETNFRQHTDELEQQIQQLNAELVYKNTQIEELKQKIVDLSTESDQTQSLIDDAKAKDNELMTLRTRLSQYENQQVQNITAPVTSDDVINRVDYLEKLNQDLIDEKAHMEHELQVLNDQVLASLEFEDKMKITVLELDAKNIEIQMLKSTLERVQSDDSRVAELERNLDLMNAQWSQAVEQRGSEVANSWKQHLDSREAEFAALEAQLRGELEQQQQKPSNIQTTLLTGESNSDSVDTAMMTSMQTMLENQELEIVSLKEQLAIRSAEYASLAAKVDPYRQMNLQQSFPQQSTDSDRVHRSELDLALYMLHQRDMRLEEMTMELVRLLEERDQLQLRLSNSLRQSEDIRRKYNIQEPESSDNSNPATPEKSPSVEDVQLKAKLSELNTVRHLRDKVIQDEREQRFIDSVSMMQRDVEHLPNEAAARIVGSSDNKSQSPSSVLMNWILGNKPDSN